MNKLILTAALGLTMLAPAAQAQTSLEWMVLRTADVHPLSEPARQHGGHIEYDQAPIPAEDDARWELAADAASVGHRAPSLLCESQVACRGGVNLTWFQTWLDVPEAGLSTLRLSVESLDDGVRVVVFNSAHPEGISPRGATLRAEREPGRLVTADLSAALVAGEENRIVLVQVDDCCGWSVLSGVELITDDQRLDPADRDRADRRARPRRAR